MNAHNSDRINKKSTTTGLNSDSDSTFAEIQDSELENVNGGLFDFKVEFQPGAITTNVDAKANASSTVNNKKFFGLF